MTENRDKKVVLVIDDNRADLAMAKFLISKEGWTPILLDNQIKALQAIKETVPSLILLDVNMPGLTGLDVLKRLKKEPTAASTPVLMLSGNSDLESVKTAINLGAVDYIIKPVDPQIFVAKVSKHLYKDADDSKPQTSEWVEYVIPSIEQPTVKLFLDATLISFGEVSFRIHCSYSLPAGATLLLEFEELRQLDMGAIPVHIAHSKEIDKGRFEIQCNLVGLPEKDLQKIRLFCKSLWRENRTKI